MGPLLREALKTICRANQWSYAAFWKIGCQNTQLLIWEDCYYESAQSSTPSCFSGSDKVDIPMGGWEGSWSSAVPISQFRLQSWEKISSLVNKMMNERINVLGQGLVGRAAFTGSHQWILMSNYRNSGQPPEVLNELQVQWTAGMQTVAVIPVLPHGVVQLGSFSAIMENLEFVTSVKHLILQLACIPGALLSSCYGTIDHGEKVGLPASLGMTMCVDTPGILASNSPPSMSNTCYQQNDSKGLMVGNRHSQLRQMQIDPQVSFSAFGLPTPGQNVVTPLNGFNEPKVISHTGIGLNSRRQLDSAVVSAEVLSSGTGAVCHGGNMENRKSEMRQLYFPGSASNLHKEPDVSFSAEMRQLYFPGSASNLHKEPDVSFSALGRLDDLCKTEVQTYVLKNQPTGSHMVSGTPSHSSNSDSNQRNLVGLVPWKHNETKVSKSEKHSGVSLIHSSAHGLLKHESEVPSPGSANAEFPEACTEIPPADDLFDVLGADLKNKLLNGRWNYGLSDDSNVKTDVGNEIRKPQIMHDGSPHVYSSDRGLKDMGLFSGMATDNLLDAVVSSINSVTKQIVDDDASSKTTVTKLSSSSIQSSTSFDQGNLSNQVKQELASFPKSPIKGAVASMSHHSKCGKDDSGNCSQTTSVFGSQISSWVEQAQNASRDGSISTAYSKRSNEMAKPTRKRLKPGENPRPRPKDRQMIQDRVKELREIVPNGAKCSIDALLEKTVKHMLFLQSVTKHADKLKQTREPKIIDSKGGILLKDNFEGGATWAFEVGSQSMVCPIIVEDLNPPRQMLVEMLCEDRGFFLEIADLIRGLGLTILKGMMETKNDKIWARFAVEANRDVTRIEIFMSLVRVLEETMSGSMSSVNASDSDNMMVHHSFGQGPSITAVGRASSLQ